MDLIDLYHARIKRAGFWLGFCAFLVAYSVLAQHGHWPDQAGYTAAIALGLAGPLAPELFQALRRVVRWGLRTFLVTAILAGVSGGALLALVSPIAVSRPLLIDAALAAAIVIGTLWTLAMRQLDRWAAERALDVQLKRELEKTHALLQAVEADPSADPGAKDNIRARHDALTMLQELLQAHPRQAVVTVSRGKRQIQLYLGDSGSPGPLLGGTGIDDQEDGVAP